MKYYYVYALKSQKDGQFYFGFTEDVHQRLAERNAGNNVSTKDRRPLDLVFFEAYPTKADALRREKYFKTTKGKVAFRLMLQSFLKISHYE